MNKIILMCWKCGKDTSQIEVFRSTVCPFCGAFLHVCKACEFYEPGLHYDCRESEIQDRVNDKEKSNFCEYFRVSKKTSSEKEKKSKNSLDAFNALFGGLVCH